VIDPPTVETHAQLDGATSTTTVLGPAGREREIALECTPRLVTAHTVHLESLIGLERLHGGQGMVTEVPIHPLGAVPLIPELRLHCRHQLAAVSVLDRRLSSHRYLRSQR